MDAEKNAVVWMCPQHTDTATIFTDIEKKEEEMHSGKSSMFQATQLSLSFLTFAL